MNKIKKEIYNLAREYVKRRITCNIGKVVEEEDKLICYVNKHDLKKNVYCYDIICNGVSESTKQLAETYKLNKPILYVFNGIDFKKDYVRIYGYNNCEIVIKDCNFGMGLNINVDGKCTIENNEFKSIYDWLNIYANNLTIKNMHIDNYYRLVGKHLLISLGADDNLSIIDSEIGKLNTRTNVNMTAANKIVIANSIIAGDVISCESKRFAPYGNTKLLANESALIKASQFNPININAPLITLNGNIFDGKDEPIMLRQLTDSLSLKRLEVLHLLKQLSKKCNDINEYKINRYSEKVNNHTIKKTLTK